MKERVKYSICAYRSMCPYQVEYSTIIKPRAIDLQIFFVFCLALLMHIFLCVVRTTGNKSDPEVIKLFSCSTQLSTKFQLLIETKIPTNEEVSCLMSLRFCIYHANKC